MAHGHHHTHQRAVAAEPGWSLLRLSSIQRLAIAGALSAALWAAVLAVIL